jgi:hypothetical protein
MESDLPQADSLSVLEFNLSSFSCLLRIRFRRATLLIAAMRRNDACTRVAAPSAVASVSTRNALVVALNLPKEPLEAIAAARSSPGYKGRALFQHAGCPRYLTRHRGGTPRASGAHVFDGSSLRGACRAV